MKIKRTLINLYNNSTIVERIFARYNIGFSLRRRVKKKPKIGIAVLIWERPEYLEICLESLFKTNLYDYDVTFLLNDDGSKDPRVKEIIEKSRNTKYKIIRNYTPKGHPSWGAAFNKAVRKLLEIDNFDIIGTCDSDAIFHPEWLDKSIKTMLWAKENHKDHKLIKFSAFNSSDFLFHKVLGTYDSPFGKYVIKERMGDVNNFFFKEDLLKIGFYAEDKDDETIMTEKFKKWKLRYFSTEISYVDHIGQVSLLNQWRPTPVENAVFGLNIVKEGWPINLKKFRLKPESYYLDMDRAYFREAFLVNCNAKLSFYRRLRRFTIKLIVKLKSKVGLKDDGYGGLREGWRQKLDILNKEYHVRVRKDLNSSLTSNLKLDIIIPLVEKDIDVVSFCIDSIRDNLKHPIGSIKIISPISEKIQQLCKDKSCIYINENDVLPINIKDINYIVNGVNRNGWLFQQLLKLAGEKISNEENYMVFDSDTILLRPLVFERNGKVVLELSDEYNVPYYRAYENIMEREVKSPLSFVAHHMIFNQRKLNELKNFMENKHGLPWYEVIIKYLDRETMSGFSEYETYGNYLFDFYRDEIILEYFYNIRFKTNYLNSAKELAHKLSNKYKTLSFQSHNT